MNRRALIVASGGIAASALSGCLGLGDGTAGAAAPGGSPTVEERSDRTIVVSNAGRVQGEPDLALLDVGVEASGDRRRRPVRTLATRAEELRTALLEFGLDEDAVTTSNFISDRVDRRRWREEGVRPDSPGGRRVRLLRGDPLVLRRSRGHRRRRCGHRRGRRRRCRPGRTGDLHALRGAPDRVTRGGPPEGHPRCPRGGGGHRRRGGHVHRRDHCRRRIRRTRLPVHRDVSFEAAASATETAGDGAATGVQPGDVTVTADVPISTGWREASTGR